MTIIIVLWIIVIRNSNSNNNNTNNSKTILMFFAILKYVKLGSREIDHRFLNQVLGPTWEGPIPKH